MKYDERLKKNLATSISSKEKLLNDNVFLDNFYKVQSVITPIFSNGGRIYVAGNGGSAADAQHFAAELVCRLEKDRISLPAESLTVDSSVLTAVGNDYGFDKIFSRQLESKMTKKDIFLAISTSGNSANIIEALKFCKENNYMSILLSANDGGLSKKFAKFSMCVSAERTTTIQELHILLLHTICECIENNFLK